MSRPHRSRFDDPVSSRRSPSPLREGKGPSNDRWVHDRWEAEQDDSRRFHHRGSDFDRDYYRQDDRDRCEDRNQRHRDGHRRDRWGDEGSRDNRRDRNLDEGRDRRDDRWDEDRRDKRRRRRSPESPDREPREKQSKTVILENLQNTDPMKIEAAIQSHCLKMQLSPPLSVTVDAERSLAFLRFGSEGNAVALVQRTPLGFPIGKHIVKMTIGQLVVPPGLQRDTGEEAVRLIQQARCAWSCVMCHATNTAIAFQCASCDADRLTHCPTVHGQATGASASAAALGMAHVGFSADPTEANSSRPSLRLPIPDPSTFLHISAISKDPLLKHMTIPAHVTKDDQYCPRSRLYFHTADNVYSTADGREYYRPKEDYLEPIEGSQITGTAKAQMTTDTADTDQIASRKVVLEDVHLPSNEEMQAKRENAKASILESINAMVVANLKTSTQKVKKEPTAIDKTSQETSQKPSLFGSITLGGSSKGASSASTIKVEEIQIAAAAVKTEQTAPSKTGELSMGAETDLKSLFADTDESIVQQIDPEQERVEKYRLEKERERQQNKERQEEEAMARKKLEKRFSIPIEITPSEVGQFGRHVGHGLCPFCMIFFSNEADLRMHMLTSKHAEEFTHYWNKLSKGVINELGSAST